MASGLRRAGEIFRNKKDSKKDNEKRGSSMHIESKAVVVYVGALISLAEDENKLELIDEQLAICTDLLRSDKEIWDFFTSPVIRAEDKIGIIKKRLAARMEPLIFHFLAVLIKRNRFDELPIMQDFFRRATNKKLNRCHVTVTSAVQLSPEQEREITEAIEGYLEKRTLITKKLQPEILGGVIMNSDDLLIDSSLTYRLQQISKALKAQNLPVNKFYEN